MPELEYREKVKDSGGREGKKQNAVAINNNNNSILQPLDSKAQEAEYMENYGGAKRLNNEVAGESDAHKEDSAGAGRNYRNGGGAGASNSSPRNHSASNGSVSSGSRTERKQKGATKSQREPLENCIPNNQLGKPDALLR